MLYFLTTTAYMTGDQSKIELSLNSGAGQSVSFSSWGSHSIPKHQLPCETGKICLSNIANYKLQTGDVGACGSNRSCYTRSCPESNISVAIVCMGGGRPGRAASFAHSVINFGGPDPKDILITHQSVSVGLWGSSELPPLLLRAPGMDLLRRGWSSR